MKSINATGLHRKSWGEPSTAFRSGPYYLFILFSGPVLEMFFDRGVMGLRPTQGD
jgi:hypothetical protein